MSVYADNTARKIKAVQLIVPLLKSYGREDSEKAFEMCKIVSGGNAQIDEYLASKESRARLRKIAFPDANHAEVNDALEAGSPLDGLYRLACGTDFEAEGVAIPPHVLRDSSGAYVKAKNGLKIIWRNSRIPKAMRNAIIARYRQH